MAALKQVHIISVTFDKPVMAASGERCRRPGHAGSSVHDPESRPAVQLICAASHWAQFDALKLKPLAKVNG
jgi:hypothetical protein